MRYSHIFGITKREANSALTAYQQLLSRAGFVRYTQDSVSLLHLGHLTVGKIASALVEALSPEAQEIGEIRDWPEGAWKLVASEVGSYKQLPISAYARSGFALRFMELLPDEESAGAKIAAFQEGLRGLGESWSLPLKEIDALYLHPDDMVSAGVAVEIEDGTSTWLQCRHCGYAAEPHAARPKVEPLPPAPLEEAKEVETPGCTTIAAVAEYLGVQEAQTLKAVFYADREGRIVFAVIRGDLDVDPVKLERAAGRGPLHVATEEELERAGMVPGYASPVGVSGGVLVVADESVLSGQNFVAGANRPGYHLTGVNAGRDFSPHVWADIAAASAGDPCPACGAPLETGRGLILGRFWQHSTAASESGGALYLNRQGKPSPVRMVSAEFDVVKWMEALAAFDRDESGLVWPSTVAPYRVHLLTIKHKKAEVRSAAEEVYAGIEEMALYDDRDASPGVKFSDADLIGLPVRITISPKSLEQGGAEVKYRKDAGRGSIVPIDELHGRLFDR